MHGEISKTPWAEQAQSLLDSLGVDRKKGLSAGDIGSRREKYGRNELGRQKRRSAWLILFDQFKNLVIIILAVAGVVSVILGQHVEAAAIVAAILVNTVIGFVTELKAVRSMDALRKLSRVETRVKRDGKVKDIGAVELVVGDIVPLEAGDIIPADIRLLEANKLQTDESALTGESEPVLKDVEQKPEETELPERTCMVYKGTSASRGSGEGIVVAVGRKTELGQIQKMVEEAEDETTPLEKRLDHLAYRLIWVVLGLSVMIALIGIVSNRDLTLMIKSAIALAVAAIPEGLPIVATVAMARGMIIMARRNALVNKLASVETLGATSVIGADKTGTLTENRMTLRTLVLTANNLRFQRKKDSTEWKLSDNGKSEISESDEKRLHEAIRIGVLCNNAVLSDNSKDDDEQSDDGSGDPMETALLAAGRDLGMRRDELLESMPEEREEAFDPDTMMMATFHRTENAYLVAVKGAPHAVLGSCNRVISNGDSAELSDDDRQWWEEKNDELANDGLRVLAVASKEVNDTDIDPYSDLTLVGLVGLLDPARQDVAEAIAQCRDAGVRVVMMTGDQPGTACKIARDIKLVEDGSDEVSDEVIVGKEIAEDEDTGKQQREEIRRASIFARVTPRQKLMIIDTHRNHGAVVAMTGDGVNDAPALKKADIGVAMGKRGTQVAKQAADMILRDDAFPTIVIAVRQGRIIFENIRKFVVYLLSGNVSEILAVATASMVNLPLPLLPLQILFLNLILDVFPALALGMGSGDPTIMKRPPRPSSESVLTTAHWAAISIYGLIIASVVLGSLVLAMTWLDMNPENAVTISFLTLSFSRLWHVFNMRDNRSNIFVNEISINPHVWGALGVCLLIIVGATYVPILAEILSLTSPSIDGWLLALAASVVPLIVGQILKIFGIVRV